jgi:hypothetical protein
MALVYPTDICNRALSKLGANLIASGALLTEVSRNAGIMRAAYDIVRRTELRRNVWKFSVKKCVLYAYMTPSNIVNAQSNVGGVSETVTWGTWASGTTYAQSDVVLGSDGQVYNSRKGTNLGNDPTLPTSFPYWELYFGAKIAQEFVATWQSTYTYAKGNNTIGSDGASYISLVDANTNNNPVGDGGVHWGAGQAQATDTLNGSYYAGDLVYVGGTLYRSLVNSNTVDPSTNVDQTTQTTYTNAWLTMTTAPTLAPLNFIYPIGTGPVCEMSTNNVFQLPHGHMRPAPQAPRQGATQFLGAPSSLPYTDWEYDDDYITSSQVGPVIYRFAADVQDTTKFDPLFVEGLAARLAYETCEAVTQSTAKQSEMAGDYAKFMGEARTVNGIEQGPTEAPEDNYIQCRA